MDSTLASRRDGVILVYLHLFSLFYFILFLTSYLLFRFPVQPDSIDRAQEVMFYSGGAILWSLRIICVIYGNDARSRQRLEFAGTLIFMYTAAILMMILQPAIDVYSRVVCLLCLTVVMAQAQAMVKITTQSSIWFRCDESNGYSA